MISKTYVLFILMSFLSSLATAASNQAFVYQGKIVKPDGTPVNSGNISFTLSLYSPNAENCLLFKEAHTVNMDGKNGAFSIAIGGGVRTDGYGGFPTLSRIFVNSGTISSLNCDVGTTYSPLTDDDRIIKVSFVDGATTVALDPLNIKAIPFALQAEQVGGYGAINLARISGAGSATSVTPNEFEFMKKLGLPATTQATNDPCAVGEILKKTAANTWTCSTDASGGALGDAGFGSGNKGVVAFDTDAATSGITVASGVAKVNLGTGANQIAQLDAGGKLLVGVMPETVFKQGGNNLGAGVAGNLGMLSAETLNLITGGTAKMTVLNSGNVGIGTAGPASLFHILEPAGGNVIFESQTSWPGYELRAATSTNDFRSVMIQSGTTGTLQFRVGQGAGAGDSSDDAPLRITTGGATSGMVGIGHIGAFGTGDPTARLMIDNSTTGASVNTKVLTILGDTGQVANLTEWQTSGAVALSAVNPSGDFGIGTAAPTSKLEVAGALTMQEMVAPALSAVNTGRIYFDSVSDTFKVSMNGAAYADLVVTAGTQSVGGPKTFTDDTTWSAGSDIYLSSTSTLNIGTGGAVLSNTGTTLNISNGLNVVGGPSTFAGDSNFDSNTLYIDSTNNRVGIGTNGPTAPFEVGSSVDVTNFDNVPFVKLKNALNTANGHTNLVFDTTNASPATGLVFKQAGTTKWDIITTADMNFRDGSNALASSLYLKAGGKNGMGGNLAPLAPLDIYVSNDAEGLRVTRNTSTSQYISINQGDFGKHQIQAFGAKPMFFTNQDSTAGGIGFEFDVNGATTSASGTRALTIINSGNIGMGIATPSFPLQVAAGNAIVGIDSTGAPNNAELRITGVNSGATRAISFYQSVLGPLELYKMGTVGDGTNHFRFRDGANNVMTIEDGGAADTLYLKAGGLVGIGTNAPSTALHVRSQAATGSAVASIVDTSTAWAGTDKLVSFKNNGVEKSFIDFNGNYAVVNGVLQAATHQSYGTNTTMTLLSQKNDGAANVGIITDNNVTMSTAGAKLVSFRNNGVEKAFIDKDGNISAPNIATMITRTLGANVGDWVELGSITGINGDKYARVEIAEAGAAQSGTHIYEMTTNWDGTAGAWKMVNPIASSGARGGSYILDVNSPAGSGGTVLRMRRLTGVIAAAMNVYVKVGAGETFTPSSATGNDGAPPTTYLNGATFTQIGQNVGIGTTTPSTNFQVVGTTRLGSSNGFNVVDFDNQGGFTARPANGIIITGKSTGGTDSLQLTSDTVTAQNGNVAALKSIMAGRNLQFSSDGGTYYFGLGVNTPGGQISTLTNTTPQNNQVGNHIAIVGGATIPPQNVVGGNVYIAGGAGSSGGANGNVILGYTGSAYQGNVGVGTIAPGSMLQVGTAGSGSFSVPGVGANSEKFGAGATVTSNYTLAVGTSSNAAADYGIAVGRNASSTTTQSIAIGSGSTATGAVGSVALGTFADATGSEAIAIGREATGGHTDSIALGAWATTTTNNQFVVGAESAPINNVYIGEGVTSTTPQSLSINATGGSGADIAGSNLTIAAGKATGNAVGGNISFQTSDAAASSSTLQTLTTKMIINTGGQVGIGMTGPNSKLEIQETSAGALTAPLLLSNNSVTANTEVAIRLAPSNSDTTRFTQISATNDGSNNLSLHLFGAAGATLNRGLTVSNVGFVGIGTTAPFHKLHVDAGNAFVSNSAADPFYYIGEDPVGTAGTYGYMKWDRTNDLIQLGTGTGGNTLTINESGSVGIGTTNPTANLHVVGPAIALTKYATDGGFSGGRANGTEALPTQVLANERINYLLGSAYYQGGTSGWSNIAGISMYAQELQTDVARGSFMTFETTVNGATARGEKMRLDNAGRLGIGVVPSVAKLEVTSTGGTTDRGVRIGATGTGATDYAEMQLSANAREFRVGVGSSGAGLGVASKYYVFDSTANAMRMVIDTNGYTGFGNTSPAATVDVVQGTATTAIVGGTALKALHAGDAGHPGAALLVSNGYPAAGSAYEIFGVYGDNFGTNYLNVRDDGRVGIGTTAPGALFHVNTPAAGAVVAKFQSGTGTCDITPNAGLSCVSDIRLKKNIVEIPDALAKVLRSRGVTFDWKGQTNAHSLGFIAQEIEKVAPELVRTSDTGYKQVNYANFVAVLTQAIKEFYSKWSLDSKELHEKADAQARQIASIEEKNKEIDLLKQKNDMLEKRLKHLEQSLNKSK